MPNLRELLNPQTAGYELRVNSPEASGVSDQAAYNELRRAPQNLDTAVGAAKMGRNPAPYAVDPNDRSGIWGGYYYDENGNPRAGRDPFGSTSEGSASGGTIRDRYLDSVNSAFAEFRPKTEDEILKEETDRIQEQINAINAVYDSRIADARTANEGRLGSTRSLNVAGGNAFDPMGAANVAETDRFNQDIIDSINAERLAEVSALMGAARGDATKRIESQTDRYIALANQQVDNLARAFGLSLDEENSLRDAAISRAQLTGYFEGDQTLGLRELLSDQAYKRDSLDLSRDELDERIEQARAAGRQVVQTDDGTVLAYDSFTNQATELGRYPSRTERGGAAGGSGKSYDDSFYDLIISDLMSGEVTYNKILYDYGQGVADDIEKRIKALQDAGRNPFVVKEPDLERPGPTRDRLNMMIGAAGYPTR